MVNFKRYTLENGLTVLLHKDTSTQMVAVNTLYKVGAKDEDPNKTGFAHLFEHLMFGGSANIPDFDSPIQEASGENNAFTNNDITNYYITLPASNLEVALWLESDRMKALDFSQESLDVQKNVVIEEFKQRYLNQPYGDVWLNLRPLAYQVHPYKWATIGEKIEHIEDATLKDVKEFFYSYYLPNNAVLSIAGNIDFDATIAMVKKWYSDIPSGVVKPSTRQPEPKQTASRSITLRRDVPLNAIYKVYHMCNRNDPNYYTIDFISDILSSGKSSRFHKELVQKTGLFTSLEAYIMGSIDPGLFVISAKLNPGVEIAVAEQKIDEEVKKLMTKQISATELSKLKNKSKSGHIFGQMEVLNKAMNLAMFENSSKAEDYNTELDRYESVSSDLIQKAAREIFVDENCSTLYYLSNQ